MSLIEPGLVMICRLPASDCRPTGAFLGTNPMGELITSSLPELDRFTLLWHHRN